MYAFTKFTFEEFYGFITKKKYLVPLKVYCCIDSRLMCLNEGTDVLKKYLEILHAVLNNEFAEH